MEKCHDASLKAECERDVDQLQAWGQRELMSFSWSDTPALYCQDSTPYYWQLLSPTEGLASKLVLTHCHYLRNRLSQSSIADGFILGLSLDLTNLEFILGSRSLHLCLLKKHNLQGCVCLCMYMKEKVRLRKKGKPSNLLNNSEYDVFQNIFNGLLILCQNYNDL